MKANSREPYILGLDLGPNSVGWAALKAEPATDEEPVKPVGILAAGSRVFEAGVEGDLEQGKEESRAVARRTARLARRGLERRGRRLMVLRLRLAEAGLLPAGVPHGFSPAWRAEARREARLAAAQARHEAIKALDVDLWGRWEARLIQPKATKQERLRLGQMLPYALRVRALDQKLEPHELGRALYHLGQRRGFLSNRKAPKKDDEKEGAVAQGIGEIEQGFKDTGSRTLGEFFFKSDPFTKRIRERYTSREQYKKEFAKIWDNQKEYHPALLTDEAHRRIEGAIFDQRKLKNQKFLVGFCELEPNSRRAPAASLEYQRFRALQQVNHTIAISPEGTRHCLTPEHCHCGATSRCLTPEQRTKLIETLDREGPLSFPDAKKLLGLKPSRNWSFNFEGGGETRFTGNTTAKRVRAVLGDRWDALTTVEKESIISDLLSIQRPETLKRRAKRVWGLEGQAADEFAKIELEDGHGSLSGKALRKLLPHLERGLAYTEAREAAGYKAALRDPMAELPPLAEAVKRKLMPEVRNPTVTRTLTELRKVVNALIRRFGRPELVRVELGRDLRNSRDRRERMWKENRQREKGRVEAAKVILKETGDANPSRADVEKVLLAEECSWRCPYTGKTISPSALLGANPRFDVEHIVPFSQCLDDSFLNKTLCEVNENRSGKRNRTPWEAYGRDEKRWGEIIERVKAFKGDAKRAKLERFQMTDTTELLSGFTSRQLNDSRYAARLAREYLGLLYGGTTDAGGIKVQVGQGRITADLRGLLRLNSILRDGGAEQKRDDHRHHPVDAVAVALTGPRIVKSLSDAAANAVAMGRRRYAPVPVPWEGFLEQVRAVIDAIKVSHRLSRKVSGRLHEDTFYSPPKKGPDGKEWVHVRKRLDSLSAKDLEGIVDTAVREAVKAKLKEIGNDDPKKLNLAENPPRLKSGVPIYTARVRRPPGVFVIGQGPHARHVISDANHHAEILEVRDKKGRVKWEGHVVPLHEAYRRLRAKEPVVKKDHGPDKRFLFTLTSGDMIEVDTKEGGREIFRVRTAATMVVRDRVYTNIGYVRNNDARLKKNIIKSKLWFTGLVDPLRKLNCRKVTITPLGEVRYAND